MTHKDDQPGGSIAIPEIQSGHNSTFDFIVWMKTHGRFWYSGYGWQFAMENNPFISIEIDGLPFLKMVDLPMAIWDSVDVKWAIWDLVKILVFCSDKREWASIC